MHSTMKKLSRSDQIGDSHLESMMDNHREKTKASSRANDQNNLDEVLNNGRFVSIFTMLIHHATDPLTCRAPTSAITAMIVVADKKRVAAVLERVA